MAPKPHPTKNRRSGLLIGLYSLVFLALGIAGMQLLAGMKTPPARRTISEKPLPVNTIKAVRESVTPFITGYGEVKALEIVSLSAEIPGRVVAVHPRLECGEVIQKGEPLFRIDIRDDERSLEINGKRLSALKRNLELAETDFSRMKKLQKLVAVSDIEKAEQAYNAMFDQVKQLEYVVFRSELNISRAVVMAPFDGRVKTVSVEKGQFVSAGMPLVTLVNDAALEVHTAIDAEKAKSVLRFKKDLESRHPSWFSELEPVPVVVVWSQGANPVKAGGVLHRVIAFEPRSRTLKLAVRLTAGGETPRPVFPIVEGMFCRVEIPGQPIPNVIRIPRQAVQGDNQVHIVVDGRLKTVPVTIRWVEDEVAFVSAGLNSDDQVIVSRLSAPLENALVESSELNLFAASRRSPR